MHKNIFFLLLFAYLWLGSSCSKFAKLQKSTDLSEKYEGAIKYYDKKEYYKASILLEEIIPLLVGRKEGEEAQYKFAYCQYYLKQYELASFYFKKFHDTFGRSPWAEESYYMYAYCLHLESPAYNLDQTNTKKAIGAVQDFLNAYPNTDKLETCNQIIKDARAKLEKKAFENARQYYKLNNYRAAIVALENFRQDYPDSDFMEEAIHKKLYMHHKLASNSIESKQIERYNDVLTAYEDFLKMFPQSTLLKSANGYYDDAVKQLGVLKKREDEREKQKLKENQAQPYENN